MRNLLLILVVAVLVLAVGISYAQVGEEPLPDFVAEARTPCEVDFSGQIIQFWHLGDLSGPLGPITQPVLAAFNDASAYFNERGGICGAEIQIPDPTTVDTGGDLEQVQVIYDRVSAENPAVLTLYGSGDSEVLREQLAEDETAVIISAGSVPGLYGEDGQSPGWTFATNPLYVDQFGQFCQFAVNEFENPVVGYVSWDTAFGRAAFTEEAVAFCESLGVEVLDEPELFLPGGDPSGNVQNVADAGANIVYTNSLASGPASIAASITNLGLSDQLTLAGVNWALDTSVGLLGLQSLGPDGLPSVNGLIGSLPFIWWTETDNPGIQLMTEVFNANERPANIQNIAYILGFLNMDIYIEAYVQTANRLGAENINNIGGADIKETLENMDYNSLQIIDINFEDGAIRDLNLNRMAVLTYAGADGGTVLDGEDPLLIDSSDGTQIPLPVVIPLEGFRETPDLRPGGEDVVDE